MTAIYVALVIYMVVLFGVGLFYSKKNATINDFLLAGRDLGVVAATLAAVLAMVVIIALTSMGGLKAVTVTDGFQIILVIIGVIWVTVVAGVAAVVVSMMLPSILDACFNAYYIFTAGVFCPIVFGVFWKKTTKQGAIAGLVAGGVFVMFALSTGFNVAGIGGELLSGILSAIVLVVVSLATQPKEIARA